MPPFTGVECVTCHRKYTNIHTHLQTCTPEQIRVYISPPEYECPGHYGWTPGPLSESYNSWLVPLDTFQRWQLIQDDWEQMNEEMHQLTGMI
jgi:hypothetical protein